VQSKNNERHTADKAENACVSKYISDPADNGGTRSRRSTLQNEQSKK
jgi:hypothetical protein